MTGVQTPQPIKDEFSQLLSDFITSLGSHITSADGQWTVKGFIDIFRNVYTISADTKIISKLLEIHLFPKIIEFANTNRYIVVPAEHQNYYPDLSLISRDDPDIKFALDLKTTYRLPANPTRCNGFTLGSHGEYFINRKSTKNIQFPYSDYLAHYCLGIIYSRSDKIEGDESQIYTMEQLESITSVIHDLHFFSVEKWLIASDKSGSGNTANIGSIQDISDIIAGKGMFSLLGEEWFDDYWMNYNQITITDDKTGEARKIRNLHDFVQYRNGDASLIVPKSLRKP